MKQYLAVTIIMFLSLCHRGLFAQENICNVHIYLAPSSDFPAAYYPLNSSGSDTIKKTISDSQYFLCYMSDCRGAMKFEAYTNGVLSVQGYYINSLDTLRHCVLVNDGLNPDQPMVVKVEKYFEPLKNGIWRYYDKNGILIKEEVWEKGILLK